MIVKELIDLLSDLPQNAEVKVAMLQDNDLPDKLIDIDDTFFDSANFLLYIDKQVK